MDKIELTRFSKSSGCGCKIAPVVLQGILNNQFTDFDSNVIVGTNSFDDAAVILINDTDCIISTADFFTPIVNDAFDFGCIAAANAISDIYAMGGKPITAISILGFPVDKLPVNIIKDILSGAQQKCLEAGITITGGHSIDAPEPFFGLSVTGTINIQHIKRNNTAKAGDKIYLTKPLGTGIFGTALKRSLLADEDYKSFFDNASLLNNIGTALGYCNYVNAMTDITGFGFLGHLLEMCEGSKLSAEIKTSSIPLLANLKLYADKFCIPDNTYRNWNACEHKIDGIGPDTFLYLNDPQTNGGLLIALDPNHEKEFLDLMKLKNSNAHLVGTFTENGFNRVYLSH